MAIIIISYILTIALILYSNVKLNKQIKEQELKDFEDLQQQIKLIAYLNNAYKDINKESDITIEYVERMRLKHGMDK